MKIKLYRIGYLVAFSVFALFVFASCSDNFFDVNENPNDPGVSTPSLTLPVAQQQMVSLNARSMMYLGNMLMYNWATPSNWQANYNYFRYDINSTFQSTIFETSYVSVFKNLTYVENYEDEEGAVQYNQYKAISLILKAFQYQYIVDIYGDVPYSEANLRGENTTPAYDSAEEVYKGNIAALSEAVDLLMNLADNDENPGVHDIIFNGDVASWIQFANTIKLRYLIRLSDGASSLVDISGEISKIESNGYGFITSNVVANPGYSDNEDKLSPFYGYFRKAGTGAQTDRGDYTVASDFTIDYLDGTNDPRLFRLYAEAEAGGYKGAPQDTDLPGEGFRSEDLSKVGPGLIKSPGSDQPVMLLAEALLLQAEAVERGYISGDAKQLYEDAITASFEFLEVPDAAVAAEDYYTQGIPNVGYDNSPNKIEAIITQKWIALNGTSSIESWMEFNRTGFPKDVPLPENTTRSHRPYRLLYPNSERARNADHVPGQTGDDAFNQKIFWQP